MTTHEKTRLIELLCSGDEQNVLLAKEICEKQNRMDIVREVLYDYLLPISTKDAIYQFVFGLNKNSLSNQGYIEAMMHVYYSDYYAQHLQSSE